MISRTIVRLGVRSIFGRWRGVLLFVLPLVLLALSVLARALVGQNDEGTRHTLYGLGLVGVTTRASARSRLLSGLGSFLVMNAVAWYAFWVWASGRASRSWGKVVYEHDVAEIRGA